MLPSNQRLNRQQITIFLADPTTKVVFNRIGTLKYRKTPTNSALSVVTGSKNQKKAVLRNKARRQLYSLFRQYMLKNKDNMPLQGMVYVSKHIYGMSFNEIKANFYALLEKSR